MGLIVLSVAILPLLGVEASQIIKAETTGPSELRLTPRIADHGQGALHHLSRRLRRLRDLTLPSGRHGMGRPSCT